VGSCVFVFRLFGVCFVCVCLQLCFFSVNSSRTMADEKPLSLKVEKRKASSLAFDGDLTCIVHFDTCKDKDIAPLSENQMKTIQEAMKKRQVQTNPDTRMDEICASIPIKFLPNVHGHHRWCYKKFANVCRLNVPNAKLHAQGRS
jgi:hypothetical protein